jgi:hypothetical protein
MYKVFFNDRTVYFGDDFTRAFIKHKGLFYKYNNIHELRELVEVFQALTKINNLYILHDDIVMLFEEFKACFTMIEAGGGLVLNKRGEFLAIFRRGTWDLPKGKLAEGEDFATAALREVNEETGLTGLKIVDPLMSTYHTYTLNKDTHILKKTRWFEMKYTGSAKPKLQKEEGITDYRWVVPGRTGFIRENSHASILDVLYMKNLL